MNHIKLRLELQLEAGDLVQPADALAAALQAVVDEWDGDEGGTPANGMLDVPRGQAAYMVEVKYGR